MLLSILRKRIRDDELLQLVGLILDNYKTQIPGKGMPLGNLTSQFFANVYLSELDYFVKHKLRAKYCIRYVDDFVILERNRELLEYYLEEIEEFLESELEIELHPEKTRVMPLHGGVSLLGFRVFYRYRLLKISNQNRIWKRLNKFRVQLARGEISREHVLLSLEGWSGYAKMGNTYRLRRKVMAEVLEMLRLHTTVHEDVVAAGKILL